MIKIIVAVIAMGLSLISCQKEDIKTDECQYEVVSVDYNDSWVDYKMTIQSTTQYEEPTELLINKSTFEYYKGLLNEGGDVCYEEL